MVTKFMYDNHLVKLSSKHQGIATPWGGNCGTRDKFRIFVEYNGEKIQFFYYCNEYPLTERGYLDALHCLCSDAIAALNAKGIDDFAEEFGYTKVSEVLVAYKGCKAAAKKLNKLGIDAYDLCNYLQETYNL